MSTFSVGDRVRIVSDLTMPPQLAGATGIIASAINPAAYFIDLDDHTIWPLNRIGISAACLALVSTARPHHVGPIVHDFGDIARRARLA